MILGMKRRLSVEEAEWLSGLADDLESGLEHFEWGIGGIFGSDPDNCDSVDWLVQSDAEGNIELFQHDGDENSDTYEEMVPEPMENVCACAIGMVAAQRSFIIVNEDHAYSIFMEGCPESIINALGGVCHVKSKVFGLNDAGTHPKLIAWYLRKCVSEDDLNIFALHKLDAMRYIRSALGLAEGACLGEGVIPNATR